MKEASKILARSIRRTLAVRGGGTPSRPGEPPRKQRGSLAKNVRTGVVGAERRVAATWFTAPILEGGIDSSLPLRSGKGRRRRSGQASRRIKIAPRPFMQRSLDAVQSEMVNVFVSEAQNRLDKVIPF
jgi:hypothetical protein